MNNFKILKKRYFFSCGKEKASKISISAFCVFSSRRVDSSSMKMEGRHEHV